MHAIIYTRVSSKDQVDNFSLDVQERKCRDYARERDFKVVKLFREEGESAKNADRTQLTSLFEYCRKTKGKTDFLIVDKVDRLARNQVDHFAIRSQLMKYGVTLHSASEPLDNSPQGRFLEGILAAVAQLDNEIRGDRALRGMQESFKQGCWLWFAPLGYSFVYPEKKIGKRSQRVAEFDALKAPLVKRVFEQYASGLYSLRQVALKANDWGLRSSQNKKLTAQQIGAILKNKFYVGLVVSKKWRLEVKGTHQPLVDEKSFVKVQSLLNRRNKSTDHRQHFNDNYPLRRFVRCPDCGKAFTAATSKGRNGEFYQYYKCFNKQCNHGSVSAEVIHKEFERLLEATKPEKCFLDVFKTIVADRWETTMQEYGGQRKEIQAELAKLDVEKSRLNKLVVKGILSEKDYLDEKIDLEAKEIEAQVRLNEVTTDYFDINITIDLAAKAFENLSLIWTKLDTTELKQRFQYLMFPKGVTWRNGRFENTQTCLCFKLLGYLQERDVRSGGPGLSSFEKISNWQSMFEELKLFGQLSNLVFTNP